ncbi:MAG: DUF5058 family protein [Acutalibacteraceae bacterium]|nr:DUF5058 family protein [Acutalibacteraceae bacterium]
MKFNVNSPIIFIMVGLIIAVVLAQSVYFLVKAVRRAKEIGISGSTIKRTISSSAIFTIAPAVAILVGVVSLSKSLGVALPWLRLSVIGSLSYETISAERAVSELGQGLETQIIDPQAFVTVAWVMTLGIMIGLILTPVLTERIQGGMNKIGMKDKKWAETFNNAMFLGMISAFLGFVFSNVSRLWTADAEGFVTVMEDKLLANGETVEVAVKYSSTSGLIPVCVMAVSAILMAICGIISKVAKQSWMNDYALPISLVGGMAAAIPITAWLG